VSDYEPPTVESPPAGGSGPSGPRAGFWRRFAAYLIDGILLAIPYVILALIVDAVLAYALYLALNIAYFGYFEGGATGQTLGKRALGIRVIDFRTGGAIGFGRGVIRYIGKIISGIPIALGFLWMLWDREKQTWHDKIATTVVVPTSAYPVS
jgi:uncharacterized RDD family membrane protein YckC